MSKVTTWKASATYRVKKVVVETADSKVDKWHVDRYPTPMTKSVKVAYGELRVTKRYGKK